MKQLTLHEQEQLISIFNYIINHCCYGSCDYNEAEDIQKEAALGLKILSETQSDSL